MLSIKIVCVGNLSQKYFQLAELEYLNRIKKQCHISIFNIIESNSTVVATNIKNESNKIEQYLAKNSSYEWFLLDLNGKMITSEELSKIIVNNQNYQQGKIGFIIGGSNGISSDLKSKLKNNIMAFGKITLPHQLCYIVLLEQVYRALQIMNNQPYHK